MVSSDEQFLDVLWEIILKRKDGPSSLILQLFDWISK